MSGASPFFTSVQRRCVRGPKREPLLASASRKTVTSTQTPKESVMNKTFVAAAVLALSAVAASAAGTDTPRIDQRQANQEQRIDQGIASGELTKREAHRMNRQQNGVNRAEDRAKADGVVTAQEKKRLTKAQNATSKRIYRQKHDAQQRPGA
jgi:hypothetical protein